MEQRGAQGQVAVAGGGGEERLALVEGHNQQIGLDGFVPEHALAVDPGGVIAQDAVAAGFCAAVRRFNLGAVVAAAAGQGVIARALVAQRAASHIRGGGGDSISGPFLQCGKHQDCYECFSGHGSIHGEGFGHHRPVDLGSFMTGQHLARQTRN